MRTKLTRAINRLEGKCKYFSECSYRDEVSYTCNNGGGPYCGVYRLFEYGKPGIDRQDD